MRKALGILLSIMLILGFISCQQPTNSSDDFANQNPTEQPKDETTDKDVNDKEELPPVVEGEEETEEQETVLNLGLTKTYSMLIGETVNLASMIDKCDVWYEIQSGNDIISCDSDFITAIPVGTAILKATDWNDESRTWKCTITVSVEGFTGTVIDYKLIGKWTCDDSYIELNSDMTGYIKVYLNGSVVQDSDFTWSTMEIKDNKYLDIANGTDYINKSYTILKISEVEFRISGYLAFGMPQETTWVKE